MPAAANQMAARTSHARGRGTKSSKQSEESRGEGAGREERMPHIYIGTWGRYAFIPSQSQLGNRQASRSRVGIEKYDDEKKSPPSLPKKGKNKGASGGETPTGLIGRRKQAIDREKPLEKTINEPWIRHKKHYTRRHPSNQPIGRTSTKSTHSLPPSPTKQATPSPPPPARGRPRRAAMNLDAKAPRSPTRSSGAVNREERSSKTSGTGGEPQPAEQARAGNNR